MNSLVALSFALCVGCASAGLVSDLITPTTAEENGFKEGTPYAREDTTVFRDMGAFVMELVPFRNNQWVTQTHVRLLWRTTQGTYYPLELIRMNWPSDRTIAVAKESIRPVAVDRGTLQLTVKFLKASTYITKKYTWNGRMYVGVTSNEANIQKF